MSIYYLEDMDFSLLMKSYISLIKKTKQKDILFHNFTDTLIYSASISDIKNKLKHLDDKVLLKMAYDSIVYRINADLSDTKHLSGVFSYVIEIKDFINFYIDDDMYFDYEYISYITSKVEEHYYKLLEDFN